MSDDEARRRAMEAVAAMAREAGASRALKEHRATAEMSHTARLALAKLTSGTVDLDTGKAEIDLDDLDAVKEALRVIQNAGHFAFLRAQGDEETYQAIGRKIAGERTPRTRGRK